MILMITLKKTKVSRVVKNFLFFFCLTGFENKGVVILCIINN